MSEYTKSGGQWLGAARSWIQCNCINGSLVTWGSNEILTLRRNFTPAVVEELAARVADAAASEMDELKEQLEDCRRRRLRSEVELIAERNELAAILSEDLGVVNDDDPGIPVTRDHPRLRDMFRYVLDERDEARALVLRLVTAAAVRQGWECGESDEEAQSCARDHLYNWGLDPYNDKDTCRAILEKYQPEVSLVQCRSNQEMREAAESECKALEQESVRKGEGMSSNHYTMTDRAVFARGPGRALIAAKDWLRRSQNEKDHVKKLQAIYECFYALRRAEAGAERIREKDQRSGICG